MKMTLISLKNHQLKYATVQTRTEVCLKISGFKGSCGIGSHVGSMDETRSRATVANFQISSFSVRVPNTAVFDIIHVKNEVKNSWFQNVYYFIDFKFKLSVHSWL